jgi:hypothetical protein
VVRTGWLESLGSALGEPIALWSPISSATCESLKQVWWLILKVGERKKRLERFFKLDVEQRVPSDVLKQVTDRFRPPQIASEFQTGHAIASQSVKIGRIFRRYLQE